MGQLLTIIPLIAFTIFAAYTLKLMYREPKTNSDFKSELAKTNQLLKSEIDSNKVGSTELELYRTIKKYLDEN